MKRLLFFGLLLFFACHKYEDGPKTSLRTKKMRLTNAWKPEKEYLNGNEITLTQADLNERLVIEKLRGWYYIKGQTLETFVWDWGNLEKDLVNFTFANSKGDTLFILQYQILKLEKKALWMKLTDAEGAHEYHYIPG